MEFDLTRKISDNTINYNYDTTMFYNNQFEKTLNNGGYIKIPYSSKSNTPNISSDLFESKYITTNLYITYFIHDIKGVNANGELIIEHKSITNNDDKPLYSCFLLRTNDSDDQKKTDIDKLISGESDVELNLNQYISSSTAIYYKNKEQKVIMFSKPIEISSNLDEYAPPKFLLPFKEYTLVNVKPNLGNIEGFEASEQYVDVATYCQPIDEEDPTIGTSTDVLIPADGKVSINKATTTQISTALNFFGFFLLVVFVVLVVPTVHQYFIISLVLDNKYNETPFTGQKLLNRLSAIDIFLSIILFGFSFSLINNGIVNNTPMNTVIGFYVFIFFIFSFITLQYNRMFDKEKFLKNFETKVQEDKANVDNVNPDIIGALSDNIFQLFLKMEKDPQDPTKTFLKFQFGWMIVLMIFFILYGILKINGLDTGGSSSIIMSIPFYMLLISIYIAIYIKHARDVRNRGGE